MNKIKHYIITVLNVIANTFNMTEIIDKIYIMSKLFFEYVEKRLRGEVLTVRHGTMLPTLYIDGQKLYLAALPTLAVYLVLKWLLQV